MALIYLFKEIQSWNFGFNCSEEHADLVPTKINVDANFTEGYNLACFKRTQLKISVVVG